MLSQGLWRRMVIGGSGVLLWVAPVSIYGLRWSVARLRPWLCILAVALRHTYNGRHPCLGMGYVREGGEGGGGMRRPCGRWAAAMPTARMANGL